MCQVNYCPLLSRAGPLRSGWRGAAIIRSATSKVARRPKGLAPQHYPNAFHNSTAAPAINPPNASYSRLYRYNPHRNSFAVPVAGVIRGNSLGTRRENSSNAGNNFRKCCSSSSTTGRYTSPNTTANSAPNSHRFDAIANPAATVSVPRYSGFRTYAYGPLCVRSRFFSRCPAAHARSASPRNATGKPTESDTPSGAESHKNAASITNPNGTRSFATRSAYDFGKLTRRSPVVRSRLQSPSPD